MRQENWEAQLRERMAGYEQPVPDGLWDDISRTLQQDAAATRATERPVGVGRWPQGRAAVRRWLSAAAVVGVLLGSGVYIYNKVRVGEDAPDAARPTAHVAAAQETTPDGGGAADAREASPAQVSPAADRRLVTARVSLSAGTADVAVLPVTHAADTTARTDAGTPTPAPADDDRRQHTPQQPRHDRPEAPVAEPARRHGGLKLSATLLASNMAGGAAPASSVQTMPYVMSRSYMGHYAAMAPPVMFLNGYEDQTEHRLPVRMGATVRVGVTDDVWAETGLVYTTVSSTFTHRLGGHVTADEQQLRYVGVPLSVGYTLWRCGRLSVYGVAGAEADFCVGTRIETDGRRGTLERDRVQFSLSAHGGAELRLTKGLGVYVQPGIRYYPDNGSALQNIFKEESLIVDMQFGVRYSVK